MNIFSIISSQQEVKLCIDGLCAVKCCPPGQIWNSISDTCKANRTLLSGIATEKQVWKEISFPYCPGGKKLSYISSNPTQPSDSIVKCIEDVTLEENHNQISRKAFVCHDQLSDPIKSKIVTENNGTTSDRKIPLTKCCNETREFYSIINDTCQTNDQASQWPPTVIFKHTNESVVLNEQNFQILYGFSECEKGSISQATSNFQLYDDGTMVTSFSERIFQAGEFCIENLISQETVGEGFSVRFCIPDLCSQGSCVRKCCPIGYAINVETETCETYNQTLTPQFYNGTKEILNEEKYSVRVGMPDCQNGIATLDPKSYPEDSFYLQLSGNIYIPAYRANERLVSEYCIDYFFTANSTDLKGLNCFPLMPEMSKDSQAVLSIFPYLLFISSIFLIATFAVYAVVPELRNLHGITIMCYVSALAVTYISLGIIQIDRSLPKFSCKALATAVHFSFLASFTWLSVLSFDIWYTFSDVRARNNRVHPKYIACSRRFIVYSIYAWGLPFIIVAVGQIIDHLPELPASVIKPEFGIQRCWFHDNYAYFSYLYGPIAVLLATDLIFFILTAIRLYGISRDSAFATRNRNTKQRVRVIFSLFILMGVSWVTEIISFASGGLAYIWIPTDIFNILTGVFIFVIFVCKKKVFKLFRKKCRPLYKYCCCFGRRSVDWDNADKSTSPASKSQANTSSGREDFKSKISMTALTNLSTRESSPEQESGQDINEDV